MAETGYDRQLAELNALLAVSRELGATTELVPLLQKIETALLYALDCERGTVFLYDEKDDELFSLVATGEETIRIPAQSGIAGEAFRTRSIVLVADAYADDRFNPEVDKATGFRTRNLLTFPMPGHDGAIVGVLQALNKYSGSFDEADEDRASALGMLAGVAIQRQRFMDELAHKQRLEHDLAVARDIQQRLLPKADPQVPGYDISGWNKPADSTGGDCYDFIPLEDGGLGILLADVTGHGIGPALIAAECRALVRALASVISDPAAILVRANRVLNEDLSSGRFVTTFFGVLDPVDHVLRYLSAGHGPLLHYDVDRGRCEELSATTYPLGIVPEIESTPGKPIKMKPGDMMVLITDGFFEWADPDGEQFSIARVSALVHEHRDRPAAQIIKALHEAVTTFGRGTPQADDLTAVIVKRIE